MRTITGKELDKAILKSQGRTWDGMPIPKLKVTDLRREAIDLLKEKAIRRGRLTEEETKESHHNKSTLSNISYKPNQLSYQSVQSESHAPHLDISNQNRNRQNNQS